MSTESPQRESLHLAKNLQSLIRARGITNVALARSVGCSPKTIGEWLTGRTPRDLHTVRKCANYFGVSVHKLLYGEEDPKHGLETLFTSLTVHAGIYQISIQKISTHLSQSDGKFKPSQPSPKEDDHEVEN